MTITQAGGQPGMDNGSIRIRGVGSFNTSSPMILIDGVEGDMNVVDANDIETISVLKDASSAAIYGSKAANGVILITTKRGKSGVPKLTYNGMAAWSAPADLMKKTSSAQYAQLINEAEYWEVLVEWWY
jgi:TonB-dependent SusC/RagA subfamily outer membrane receptor